MPYNSYRFGCEHVLLKRLSFLSKLSIILNCHSEKGSFLSMGEGVLSQTTAGRAGYTHAHTEACTCTHTHAHTCACAKCPPPPVPVLPPFLSHWCHPSTARGCSSGVSGVGTRHSQGTDLGTLGGPGRSVPNQNCQKIIIRAERRQSLFSPHNQVDVCVECLVFWQSSARSFLSSNSVFIV